MLPVSLANCCWGQLRYFLHLAKHEQNSEFSDVIMLEQNILFMWWYHWDAAFS